jgi:Fe-S-cluster containining protein
MATNMPNQLCLKCGLCCNGVIFADGQLQPGDDAARLKACGLRFKKDGKFRQPCVAFDGSHCAAYQDRPKYCREFECLVFKDAQAGRIEIRAALRVIRNARRRAEKVRSLLRELGDTDERKALDVRFRQTSRRIESGDVDGDIAGIYGQLTLAIHDLHVLLGGKFYFHSI